MEVYSTEEEQVEAIKKWWRENWKSLAGGILLGLAVLYGGRAYLQKQDNYTAAASVQFDAMVQALAQDKPDVVSTHAETLLGQFADTAYAVTAALTMAKIKVDAGDLLAAESHLRWALNKASHEGLKHTARLRLARVLLANGKADDALQSLSNVNPGSFTASYEEVKGDIYVAKGSVEQARSAYSLALAALKPGDRGRNFLEMKLDDLGVSPAPESAS